MIDRATRNWLRRHALELTVPLFALSGVIGIFATGIGFMTLGHAIIKTTVITMIVTCLIVIHGPMKAMLADARSSWRGRHRQGPRKGFR